ncbi:unnamed protein product, partial [Iphiclides podalirius]
MDGEIHSLESIINNNLNGYDLEQYNRIHYGRTNHIEVNLKESSSNTANDANFDIAAYSFPAKEEQTRSPRIVKIGLIQHSIVTPTDQSIIDQKNAILQKVKTIIDTAGEEGVNVLCLQELWNMPIFFGSREKQPWCEFSESAEDGPTTRFLRELAIKYAMVIVSSILERDENHGDVLWNTAVVISDTGNVIGKHRKSHIPRGGDLNESTYYMEGNTGHPVFATRYGKIAVNIGFGRHHVLNWMIFGLNGAEIVFNPSATVGGDCGSEHTWNIGARNAAITNGYFTAAINRVGYERFPNEFTSGDGMPAHNVLGPFYGSSYICGPNGVRSPGLSRTRDGLLIGVLDLNLNRQVRDSACYQMTQRLELYLKSLSKALDFNYDPQVIHEHRK